jgi:hypothetical protein
VGPIVLIAIFLEPTAIVKGDKGIKLCPLFMSCYMMGHFIVDSNVCTEALCIRPKLMAKWKKLSMGIKEGPLVTRLQPYAFYTIHANWARHFPMNRPSRKNAIGRKIMEGV